VGQGLVRVEQKGKLINLNGLGNGLTPFFDVEQTYSSTINRCSINESFSYVLFMLFFFDDMVLVGNE
jgi:hypothetical protein